MKGGFADVKYYIELPAINKKVSIGAYVKAVKMAKENPDEEFAHGFTTWWPTKGAGVMRQFGESVVDRINQHMEIKEDRKGRALRLLAYHKKVGRECKWCGTRFFPKTIHDDFCDDECRADYWG
jgi:uncharacterized OB-fold protein